MELGVYEVAIDEYKFHVYRFDSLGYNVRTTINFYYKSVIDQDCFLDRWGCKRCSPKTWIRATSILYNYLAQEWGGKYRPMIVERQLASKETCYIGLDIVFYSTNQDETEEFYNRFKADKRFKGIVKETYCYTDTYLDLPHVRFCIHNLGDMEIEDYEKFQKEFSEYLYPIRESSKSLPLFRPFEFFTSLIALGVVGFLFYMVLSNS